MHAKTFIALVLTTATAFAAPIVEGIEARQNCPDVAIFFARGTSEPGTLGTVVGPEFQAAVQGALGGRSLSFVGINYPATIAGFLAGGDPGGAQTMANSVTSTANSCLNTKIVISGYRQGFLLQLQFV
jgi:cutinase